MVPFWRNRDFMLLRGGQAISAAGSRVSTIAFPLLVLALTRSPAQAGIVGFANTLPIVLFTLPAGALSVFFTLSESAAVPRVVPPNQLTAAVPVNESTRRGAELIGPSLGGLLFSSGDGRGPA